MKLAILLLFPFLFAAIDAHAMGGKIPTESGNYCKDEANEWIVKRFGAENKAQSMTKAGSGRDWQFWAKVPVCDGAIVLDFAGTEGFECTNAQYGSRTRYLRQIWGYGDCERVLPRPEFPVSP